MIPLCFPKISMNLWVHLQLSTEGVTDSGLTQRISIYFRYYLTKSK
ncbi:MAG: hypothetical protein P8X79_04520 [Reinekea sp.]